MTKTNCYAEQSMTIDNKIGFRWLFYTPKCVHPLATRSFTIYAKEAVYCHL